MLPKRMPISSSTKKGEDPLGLMSEPRLVMINGVIVRREDTI